jgi:hypothetical protein
MFCPKCSANTGDDAAHYCRSCGFRLDNVALLMTRNGELESIAPTTTPMPATKTDSPREKGLRLGGKMLFFSFLTFPFFITLFFYAFSNDHFWRAIMAVLIPAILVFLSVMRMLYAWLFHDPIPVAPAAMAPPPITANRSISSLPGAHPAPLIRTEVPNTSNVNQPSSVTEPTTSLLGKQ